MLHPANDKPRLGISAPSSQMLDCEIIEGSEAEDGHAVDEKAALNVIRSSVRENMLVKPRRDREAYSTFHIFHNTVYYLAKSDRVSNIDHCQMYKCARNLHRDSV